MSTKVNQIWQDLGSKGYVFCVTEPILTNEGLLWVQPITPPVSIGSVVYVQVDSWNEATKYGAIMVGGRRS